MFFLEFLLYNANTKDMKKNKQIFLLNVLILLVTGAMCLFILSACRREPIAVPVLTIENGSIKWQTIENSDYYLVGLNDDLIATEDNFYDLSLLNEPGKSYLVKVMVKSGNNYSMWSEEINLTKLLTPTVEVNGFNINWTADNNASAYKVVATDGINTNTFITENNWFNPSTKCGEAEDVLTVTVTAIGKNKNYLDSNTANAKDYFVYPQCATLINDEEFFNDLTNFNYSGTYYLTNNIDLTKSSFQGFKDTFKGTFCGNSFKITLGDVISEANRPSGLFASINSAIIKNLNVEANYSTSHGWVGR